MYNAAALLAAKSDCEERLFFVSSPRQSDSANRSTNAASADTMKPTSSILTSLLKALLLATLVCSGGCATIADKLQHALTSDSGAVGEIHGSIAATNVYVFVYRNPKDFFDFREYSLVPATASVAATLADMQRHDRVRIKGRLLDNPTPQGHIELSSLTVEKKYAPAPTMPAYVYTKDIRDELAAKDSGDFLVHAVQAGGRVLVVEYRDTIVPVRVTNAAMTQSLARNDVVRLRYRIPEHPDAPLHLELQEQIANPVQVLESALAMHGKEAVIEGNLVLFPVSPQVRFNVFAVQQKLAAGLQRQYTLLNQDDEKLFTAIREKLQSAWDRAPTDYVSGRNKLVNTKIKVRVTGNLNAVDANQANVQVLLAGPESIEVLTP